MLKHMMSSCLLKCHIGLEHTQHFAHDMHVTEHGSLDNLDTANNSTHDGTHHNKPVYLPPTNTTSIQFRCACFVCTRLVQLVLYCQCSHS